MLKNNLIVKLLLSFILAVPTASSAGVFWTEDFENHLYPNWISNGCLTPSSPDGASCGYPQISGSLLHTGKYSGLQHYSSMNVQAGTFLDRYHPVTNDVWIRWYQYTSNFNYGDGSVVVKHIIMGAGNYGVYWENLGSSEMFANLTTSQNTPCPTRSNALDMSCNLRPNMKSVPLQNGQWYCIEGHINGGTAGAANGTVEMFVNGIQTIGYYNIPIKFPTDSQAGFSIVRYYAQNGSGDRYTDDLAVGTTRIGCSGGSSTQATPTAAPTPPTGLIVQ